MAKGGVKIFAHPPGKILQYDSIPQMQVKNRLKVNVNCGCAMSKCRVTVQLGMYDLTLRELLYLKFERFLVQGSPVQLQLWIDHLNNKIQIQPDI